VKKVSIGLVVLAIGAFVPASASAFPYVVEANDYLPSSVSAERFEQLAIKTGARWDHT
jgi:hypothetical protein